MPRRHGWSGCACVTFFIALFLGVLAGISYGIAYGVEKGLTGEGFEASGHGSLFRICETSTTTANIFRAHTCNVFAPGSDTNAPPKHAFTELNELWLWKRTRPLSSGHSGAWPLEELLRLANLQCEVTDPTVASRDAKAQILIGQVVEYANSLRLDEKGPIVLEAETGIRMQLQK
ncbi:hypothetical protein P389DRAFT_181538 [Cystobasidium minutum MCA 4210]|uniref:uncharacterized protein n=1 Tax=Cystobasidium minutum MCA 4210 TaxID=1397322 RepID=UPI0034CF952A|eukprot:jgi/Rhomi1/181538/fgenesh1_pg.7_\